MEEHERRHWPPAWPDIDDKAVLAALAAVPRHLFVPGQFQQQAYEDLPLPIGEDQTISQPYIVALMTQALALKPTSRVLEIGTGSGYQAAILAQLSSHVYSVECRPELAKAARCRLLELGCPVKVRVGDGCLGWLEHAPYDGIIVTAAAPAVPPALVAQLADGGRLVIPVGHTSWDQRLWLIRRTGKRLQMRWLADVRFVPLLGDPCGAEGSEESLAEIRRQLQEGFNLHS